MTRLEVVTETLRHALNVLAIAQPNWLFTYTADEWVDRYNLRVSEYRLPKGQAKRQTWAEQVGNDGKTLLEALFITEAPPELRNLPAVETLRQVWIQNFYVAQGKLLWRDNNMVPPAKLYIGSPMILTLASQLSAKRIESAIQSTSPRRMARSNQILLSTSKQQTLLC